MAASSSARIGFNYNHEVRLLNGFPGASQANTRDVSTLFTEWPNSPIIPFAAEGGGIRTPGAFSLSGSGAGIYFFLA